MTKKSVSGNGVAVESLIHTIRGQRVILDADLARIYGVPTKRLNEQVRRNVDRFPSDFVFQLEPLEITHFRLQCAALSVQPSDSKEDNMNRSQFATSSSRHRDPRFRPYAFTEHGAIMVATVLNSPQAIQMSVFVVRAFVRMHQMLSVPHDLSRKLAELEGKLTARLDGHETAITEVLQQIMLLLNPPPAPDQPHDPPAKQIGFHVELARQ